MQQLEFNFTITIIDDTYISKPTQNNTIHHAVNQHNTIPRTY